jgi:hypothetical protein
MLFSILDGMELEKLSQYSVWLQTSSEAHPASYPMGTGGPFLRVKRSRGVKLTTHLHLVPKSRMN